MTQHPAGAFVGHEPNYIQPGAAPKRGQDRNLWETFGDDPYQRRSAQLLSREDRRNAEARFRSTTGPVLYAEPVRRDFVTVAEHKCRRWLFFLAGWAWGATLSLGFPLAVWYFA